MAQEYCICRTCGVQHGEPERLPERCLICDDERQYVGWQGQQWITLSEMREQGYRNEFREIEPGLVGVRTEPHFGIGQRALLVRTDAGNVFWDGNSFIDDDTIERITNLGGIAAIAVSHPHFYGSIVEYSHAFGNAPIYLPKADAAFIARRDSAVELWEGSVELVPGVTLVQCGGHFPGSAVVHWAAGANGRGAILTGDSIAVAQDRDYVSFMWSFPNFIPLPADEVRRVALAVRPYEFDRLYGGWWHSVVNHGGKAAVDRSAERYVERMQELPDLP